MHPGPEPSFIRDGVTVARSEYLFPLARVCHVSPPQVDSMTIADFGLFTLAIDEMSGDGEVMPGGAR